MLLSSILLSSLDMCSVSGVPFVWLGGSCACCRAEKCEGIVSSHLSLFPFLHTAFISFTVTPVEALLPLFQLPLSFSLLVLEEPCPLVSVFVIHDVNALSGPRLASQGVTLLRFNSGARVVSCAQVGRERDKFENTK